MSGGHRGKVIQGAFGQTDTTRLWLTLQSGFVNDTILQHMRGTLKRQKKPHVQAKAKEGISKGRPGGLEADQCPYPPPCPPGPSPKLSSLERRTRSGRASLALASAAT